MDNNRLAELVQLIKKRVQEAPLKPPALQVASNTEPIMDTPTRASYIKMIRHYQKAYGLNVLVDQATFGCAGLDELGDTELIALMRRMERGRECYLEGVSLDDAGLVIHCHGD